jgi:LysM repeat protein
MFANPTFQRTKHQDHSVGPIVLVSAVLVLTLMASLACGWLMLQTVASYYATRMYPNVYVLGMKLGRMTTDEATILLADQVRRTAGSLAINEKRLLLDDGQNSWSIPWSDAGMHLDVEATVEAAFSVGHTGNLGWQDQVRRWLQRHDVPPIFAVNTEQARGVLERLAPSVAIPPTNATLQLPQQATDPVLVLPGRLGRELDIQASLAQLLAAAEGNAQTAAVSLVFRPVLPQVQDVTQQQVQVEGMLGRQIDVSTYDVVADKAYHWTLGRSDILSWLQITPTPSGPVIEIQPNAVQRTLEDLSAQLGDERGFQWADAVEQVMSVFEEGGGAANLYLTYREKTHIVQPGDTLSSVAAAYGMTPWQVMRSNPEMNPDWLTVGQKLTIPSQNVLTPLVPVADKRITVSVAEQRLRAYEKGKLVYDWPVSTGVTESPTHTGIFQVLSKEENAYASLWDLWMPHFIGIYTAGPGFYNGFHGLPTLSSGRRLWEGLLGSPASYGCIILGLEEADTLYQWAEMGVIVTIE